MPEIGEIKKGIELGLKTHGRLVWHACERCSKERWVLLWNRQPKNKVCKSCSNLAGKGGRIKAEGYILIYLFPNHPFFPMARSKTKWGGYVPEHRLVMAEHLGRCLESQELVHHKDGVKEYNDYNNLELKIRGGHIKDHSKGYRNGYQQGYLEGLRQAKEDVCL